MNYNLLDEKWIPVLYDDGTVVKVGIRKVLAEAHMIRQIAASNPMDRVAIFRFLLALLYWCKGNPPDDLYPRETKAFPVDWFVKLDENKDCFNLLGEGKRFYQDEYAKRRQPATNLFQEIPSGHNFWHFRHSTDNKEGLCLGCCTLGLLRLPLFSVSGLSGPGQPPLMAGINGVPPIYVIPWGTTLKKTLLLNWIPCKKIGVPCWERQISQTIPQDSVPSLTGLTLLSRRVWLHTSEKDKDVCISCGLQGEPIVKTIEFQTAGKQESEQWCDPHVVYIEEKKRKSFKAEDLTAAGRFKMDRPCLDILTHSTTMKAEQTLLVVGFATDNAKNVDVWERVVKISNITQKESSMINLWKIAGRALEKLGGHPQAASSTCIASIRPQVETQVFEKINDLSTGGHETWQHAADEYRPMMKAVAGALSPGFTTAAVLRRQQIAVVVPDMRPKTESKKRKRKEE